MKCHIAFAGTQSPLNEENIYTFIRKLYGERFLLSVLQRQEFFVESRQIIAPTITRGKRYISNITCFLKRQKKVVHTEMSRTFKSQEKSLVQVSGYQLPFFLLGASAKSGNGHRTERVIDKGTFTWGKKNQKSFFVAK